MRLSSFIVAACRDLLPSLAVAQDYPTRPIKAITTTSAGGLSDIFMRALGDELQQALGPAADHREPAGRLR